MNKGSKIALGLVAAFVVVPIGADVVKAFGSHGNTDAYVDNAVVRYHESTPAVQAQVCSVVNASDIARRDRTITALVLKDALNDDARRDAPATAQKIIVRFRSLCNGGS